MTRTGIEGRRSRAARTSRAALALTLLAAALAACGGTAERHAIPPAPPVAARVETASDASWERSLEVAGSLAPFRRASPGTLLMGRVERVLRREGDRVAAGDVLAVVESREVSARVAQAEAGVTAARAMETSARLMKERMERLEPKGAATRRNVEDATAGYEAAAAALRAAEQQLAAARMYLAYSQVAAPLSGVVVERRVEAGDMAAPGMPLFVVEDTARMKVEAQVPESAAVGLKPGQPLEVRLDALDSTRPASLAEVLPSADPRSRTITIRAVLDNPDGAMRSGMFARVRLTAVASSALSVPEPAVVRRGPLTGVFVVDDGRVARLRWIAVGQSRAGRVEVLAGLSAGERYVAEVPSGLVDGQPVEVR